MNRYTVNFSCVYKDGRNLVRSEEIVWIGLDEAVEMVKRKWGRWNVKILWAGIRLTDGI